MQQTMEPPDPLAERDLLVAETTHDVTRQVLLDLLARGMSPAAILAEIPTVAEADVRAAMAAVPN